MKRIVIIATLLLLALAVIPDAHATLRIQSVSSGLFTFDGPTRATYSGDNYATTYNYANDRAFIGAHSRTGGASFGLALQRPTTTTQHYFDNPNDNYRTRSHGDWQLGQAHFSWPNRQTAISVGQTHGHYAVRGNINGYTGGPSYGSPNAFARTHGIPSQTHPHTYSSFGYTSTRSAYTQTGRAYY